MFAVLDCLDFNEPPVIVNVFDAYDDAYENVIKIVVDDMDNTILNIDRELIARKTHSDDGTDKLYVAGGGYVALMTENVTVTLTQDDE